MCDWLTSGERETVEIMNSAGVQKLNKDSDRISTGSIQSPGKYLRLPDFASLVSFCFSFASHEDGFSLHYADKDVMGGDDGSSMSACPSLALFRFLMFNACPPLLLTDKDLASSQGILHTPPPGSNPFESSKSEDEEEEEESPPVREEEEGPFLETDLADKDAFIQPGACPAVVMDDEESDAFGFSSSRADEAIRTCEYAPCWSSWISQQAQQVKLMIYLREIINNGSTMTSMVSTSLPVYLSLENLCVFYKCL